MAYDLTACIKLWKNFEYSILDIFKSTTDDQTIITRENWWKSVLKTRNFGYNKN